MQLCMQEGSANACVTGILTIHLDSNVYWDLMSVGIVHGDIWQVKRLRVG